MSIDLDNVCRRALENIGELNTECNSPAAEGGSRPGILAWRSQKNADSWSRRLKESLYFLAPDGKNAQMWANFGGRTAILS